MTDEAGEFAGLTQEEANEQIVARLEERGPARFERSRTATPSATATAADRRIEPLVSLQWWCEMSELAKPAIDVVARRAASASMPEPLHEGLPRLDGGRSGPWCISRQLWWGHRIPAWYCPEGHVTVAEIEPDACAECGSTELTQDEDVLDTWFSSALWPFATLGWPEETPELEPGTRMTSARPDRGIIFLWEARMIMAGIELMGERPVPHVNIHSTINAPDGRRMSKSLGTGIDPTRH